MALEIIAKQMWSEVQMGTEQQKTWQPETVAAAVVAAPIIK